MKHDNTLFNIDIVALQANFQNTELGLCKLEFIINDNEEGNGKQFVEPYVIAYDNKEPHPEESLYIELLDTDIVITNLYETLSLMTLHHIK